MELSLLGTGDFPWRKSTVTNTLVVVSLLAIQFVITLQIRHNNTDVTWNSEALLTYFPQHYHFRCKNLILSCLFN
jgi:hypothetical protein